MSVTDAIKAQRTVRAFKPEQVPESVIREVIELAKLSPSNGNTQPCSRHNGDWLSRKEGYGIQNSFTQHFGLGTASQID